jgi:hypothetical protein
LDLDEVVGIGFQSTKVRALILLVDHALGKVDVRAVDRIRILDRPVICAQVAGVNNGAGLPPGYIEVVPMLVRYNGDQSFRLSSLVLGHCDSHERTTAADTELVAGTISQYLSPDTAGSSQGNRRSVQPMFVRVRVCGINGMRVVQLLAQCVSVHVNVEVCDVVLRYQRPGKRQDALHHTRSVLHDLCARWKGVRGIRHARFVIWMGSGEGDIQLDPIVIVINMGTEA